MGCSRDRDREGHSMTTGRAPAPVAHRGLLLLAAGLVLWALVAVADGNPVSVIMVSLGVAIGTVRLLAGRSLFPTRHLRPANRSPETLVVSVDQDGRSTIHGPFRCPADADAAEALLRADPNREWPSRVWRISA